MLATGNHFKIKTKKKYSKGTTLVEVLLYIALSAFVLIDLSGTLSQIIYDQTKIEAIGREDENARTIMRLISQSIEESSVLNSPNSVNATSSTLNLTDLNNNTIVYSISSGIVYKTINNGTAVAISSNDIYVSNLTFTVESEAGVAPSINVAIDIQQSQTNTNTKTHYETTDAQRKL